MTLGKKNHNQQHKAVKPGVVMLVGQVVGGTQGWKVMDGGW